MNENTLLKFYRLRPFYFHFYTFPLLLIAPSLPTRARFELTVLFCSLSFVLFLSTYWTTRSLLIQCYTQDDNGSVVLYRNVLCKRLVEGKNTFFFYNGQKHQVVDNKPVKIEAKCDFTLKQYKNLNVVQDNYDFFQKNTLCFPEKTFFTLFKEQIVSPLFCFQIFSSILTLFDDYVYNSLFSMGLTVSIEAMMVLGRMQTLKMFKSYGIAEKKVKKIENNKTVEISTFDLKPSDLIELDIEEVPCDLLIISGSAAVSEAMLSGESVPVVKSEIEESNKVFSFKAHKKHVLFAGTKIEKFISDKLICITLRTSFNTEQGKLLKSMLESEEVKSDKEALKFVLILSGISLFASLLTFFFSRKKGYPLFLDIIILFTNSIPFELPMEMGMSVQMAVKSLMGKKIYCLEPFRIQLAGKLNVCCFDKTGTLTSHALELKEIRNEEEIIDELLSVCHSLIEIDGKLHGDSLEMSISEYLREEKISIKTPTKIFPFTSEKKRQAVIAEVRGKLHFVVKGAPEAIEPLLERIPRQYEDYRKYASGGNRVISVAYKEIREGEENLENNLKFAGFLLFGCTLKEHAKETIKALSVSGHRVVMITGDNLLTALSVASQVGMHPIAGVEGQEIDAVLNTEKFTTFSVFARADPKQKEMILRKYKSMGEITMMVGDGTNDVGALKAADVGIAIMSGENKKMNGESKLNLNINIEPVLNPGDASVAAPFTVKSHSLRPVLEIIKQGRTSAVTTVQMYKILALNSLIGGFTMGFLDLFAIKFSEKQMLSLGYLNAMAFNAISRGRTLEMISPQRVVDSIFCRYIIFSLIGQATLHTLCFVFLVYVLRDTAEIRGFYTQAVVENVKFSPSVVNTAVYALGMVQTIATFSVNYIGRPFREDITENVILFFSLLAMAVIPFNILSNIYGDINNYLECVDLGEYKGILILLCFIMLFVTYVIEKTSKTHFMIMKSIH
ncbi:P-type ATPase [Nucleospora cyclopteri]